MGQQAAEDYPGLLTCPTYAFGIRLEPEDETSDWVQAFNFVVPEKFWYYPLSLQLEKYEAFFEWLESQGFVRQSGEAPTVVPIVDWLYAQKVISGKARMKIPNKRINRKIEQIQAFVWKVLSGEAN